MKNLRLLTALAATLLLLSACSMPQTPVDTTADTTPAVEVTTPAPETTVDPNRKIVAKGKLMNSALGLRPHSIEISDLAVLDCEIMEKNVLLYGYTDGSVTLSIADCFGHTASAQVTVSGDSITVEAQSCTEKFIEASTQFGAVGSDSKDDTAAIQAAIDSAKSGQTVYLYPGIYKVDHLVMREGVTLEMYTTMTDAHEGFTDSLASKVRRGDVTVLSGVRIMNAPFHTPGRDGSSNFTIRGGVLDMNGTGKSAIIIGTADGVTIENVLFKDVKNDHAIQITGCTNTIVRNCLFAGYIWDGVFTREVLQVEISTSGATGAVENAPLVYEEGEFNYSANIEISHCYFGKSDECGAPLMAIGHHAHHGYATVENFVIKDNVFDEVMYAAIRYSNIVGTEITGNTFISTKNVPNVKHDDAKNPAFIVLYCINGNTNYVGMNSGKRVTVATTKAQAGIHGMNIHDNTFRIGEGSDKRVIYVTGTSNTPGLFYESGQLRQKSYTDATPYTYDGYTACSNYIENVDFVNNIIEVEGQPAYNDHLMYFSNVNGLEVSGNTLRLGSATFTSQDAISKKSCTTGSYPTSYTVFTGAKGNIMLSGGSVRSKLSANGSYKITLISYGGHLEFTTDAAGNATVTPVADNGYRFDGWIVGGNEAGAQLSVTSDLNITAKFVKK